MSHGITSTDTMMSVRKVPWHGLGVVLQKQPKSIDDALDKSGLGWKVEQVPLALASKKHMGVRVPGFVANVRSDNAEVLGIVGEETYEVVQNKEAFDFLAQLLGSELLFETAGSLHGGRRVFVLARRPDWVTIGGDETVDYVLVTTAHDGSGAAVAKPTNVRVVCQNTLTASMGDGKSQFSIRHTTNASVRLAAARQTMAMQVDYSKQFKKFGDKLATQKMSDRQLMRTLEELYPNGETDRQVKASTRTREAIAELFFNGKTVGNAPGSKWCAWNAVVEHHQHDVSVRAKDPRVANERRFVRAMEDPQAVSARALKVIQAV